MSAVIWDAPMVAATARELGARLGGARLRAVRMDRDARNLLLHFRDSTLLFRLHPLHGDVTLHPPLDPPAEAHALKARLREVRAPPDERLLLLQLQPPGGGSSPEGIVIELMTNQWNAIWLDVGTERIRRVLWPRETGERALVAGERYRRPAPSERRGIERPLDRDQWLELLADVPPDRRRRTLLRTVAFTSSVSAAALLPGGEDDDLAALERGHALWRRIRAVALGEEDPDPRLLHTEKRVVPYPLPVPGMPDEPSDGMLDGFRRLSTGETDDRPDAALLPSGLLERLERAVEAAERKVEQLRRQLDETPDPEPIRRVGDLILARFGEVPRGVEAATLEGFDGEPVEVELDPSLPPDENAERYYDRAARAERARKRLPAMIATAGKRADQKRALLRRARRGEAGPEEVEEALPPESSRDRGRRRDQEGTGLPYRTFRSSGGIEIRVGRGAKANDELTFHHSRPDDVWLHARRVAGAHVILRWDRDGNPPARDLAEAAVLAALHSDARHSGSVPVDWTRRKYVRSPRKSPPGVVVPQRVQTVFVDPDPAVEKRLREG